MTFPIRVADGRLEIDLQYEDREFAEGAEYAQVCLTIKVPDTEGMEYNMHDVSITRDGRGIEVFVEAIRELEE